MKKFEDSEEKEMLEKFLSSLPIEEKERKTILALGRVVYLAGQFEGLIEFENLKDLKKIKEV